MAEYFISYKEMYDLIDEYIAASSDRESLTSYRAEIMSAITGEFYQRNTEAVREMIALWENQVVSHSEALLGTKYIRVRDSMISFLEKALCSGVVDAVIQTALQGSVAGFTISAGVSVAIALWELFSSVKTLEDWDFCIYMQAVTHFREHAEFTLEELRDWLPSDEKPICNMHNDTWECDHLGRADTCMLREKERLERALQSLIDKGILLRKMGCDTYLFKFK